MQYSLGHVSAYAWSVVLISFALSATGRTGLLCPCVLFGRNIEQLREDTPWTGPCICHAIFVEGGIAFAAATAALHGFIDPRTTFLICEGLFFSWWMCGIYTGLVRQSLQKKYHLKVSLVYSYLLAFKTKWFHCLFPPPPYLLLQDNRFIELLFLEDLLVNSSHC